jgi:antibiotic biosynthesis monooxygenase (ABM) superfamily enzyme
MALLPQVILLSFIIPKVLPFPVGVALSTAIPVAMLTWVVMPRLTKLLYSWLYAPPRRLAS